MKLIAALAFCSILSVLLCASLFCSPSNGYGEASPTSDAVAGPARATEFLRVLPDSLTSARVALPGGMDPMDVRRAVERNLGLAAGEASFSEVALSSGHTSAPVHVGGVPVYGPARDYQNDPVVAFGGGNYLVVWEHHGYSIVGARVSPSGTVLDSAGIVVTYPMGYSTNPAVAFDGTNFLVVWEDERDYLAEGILGARVSADGVVLDAEPIVISVNMYGALTPALTFGGDCYLVVWRDLRTWAHGGDRAGDIYGARVDKEGDVLDADGIPICTIYDWIQRHPAVSFDGSGYFVVWEDDRSGVTNQIYGARVSSGGEVQDTAGIPIATQTYAHANPAVAYDGSNYLVVWEDYRAGHWDIYGSRVTPSGAVTDTAGIAVCTDASEQLAPDVAFDGENHLVVWEDARGGTDWGVYGCRVSPGGGVLDPGGGVISEKADAQSAPCVAFDGTCLFVAWEDDSGTTWDILGVRLNQVLETRSPGEILISLSANEQDYPAVASDGTDYLVVWHDYRNGDADVYGARVSTDGVLLDPEGMAISVAPNNQGFPAVAYGGSDYLVVWEDYRSGDGDIYGARVGSDGEVTHPEGIAICTTPYYQGCPSIAVHGTQYFVVWQDNRRCLPGECQGIYGARVSLDGTVLDTASIAISTAPDGQMNPSVAFDGIHFLVVWDDRRFTADCIWSSEIFGARVSQNGTVLDPEGIRITSVGCYLFRPCVACDGTNCLVAWEDDRNSGLYNTYGTRVALDGTVLEPDGIAISQRTTGQMYPAVLFDGTGYLVVWGDGGEIWGTRVSMAGAVLDADGIPISTGPLGRGRPALAQGPNYTQMIAHRAFVSAPYGCARIWADFWQGPVPVVISAVEATGQAGRAVISWHADPNTPASSFWLERADEPDGVFLRLDAPVTGPNGSLFSCTDYGVVAGRTYWYNILLAGASGNETFGPVEVRVDAAPAAYCVYQNSPNPFNPLCTIRYATPRAGRVRLAVFDVSGAVVRTITDGWREPGVYDEVWDGRDNAGAALPSGVYFYSLEADDFTAARKMVLLR